MNLVHCSFALSSLLINSFTVTAQQQVRVVKLKKKKSDHFYFHLQALCVLQIWQWETWPNLIITDYTFFATRLQEKIVILFTTRPIKIVETDMTSRLASKVLPQTEAANDLTLKVRRLNNILERVWFSTCQNEKSSLSTTLSCWRK